MFGSIVSDGGQSAIAYDLPLYSCNPSDFDAIPRLDLRTVPTPITASHEPAETSLPKGVGAQYNMQHSTTAEQTCPFTQCLERCHAEAALRTPGTEGRGPRSGVSRARVSPEALRISTMP